VFQNEWKDNKLNNGFKARVSKGMENTIMAYVQGH
jgi:hypothetical protein